VHALQGQIVDGRRAGAARPTGRGDVARKLLVAAVVALLCVGAFVAAPSSLVAPVGAQDGPTVSIGDVSGLERDEVFGSVMVPLFLDRVATEPVVVSYYTVNGTAIYFPPEDRVDPELFGDYQRRGTPEIPRTVTIPAGALQTSINIVVNVDDEVEPDEQFDVVIASVSGADATIGRSTGTATIVDPDGFESANPVITVSSGSVVEGDSGQRRAQFFVHLDRPATSIVAFSYTTTDGSATAPGDYVSKLPGTATLAPGQISKTIDVLVGSDTTEGADRSFTLEIGVLGGAPVEELRLSGTATVLDDDQPPPNLAPTAAFSSQVSSLTASFDASASSDPDGSIVSYAWTFGDGSTGTGAATTRSYTAPGTYTVTLTVTDDDGATDTATAAVTAVITPSVAAGNNHTCRLDSGGGIKCWGDNSLGQLGNGTTTSSLAPVSVTGLTSGVTAIAAGDAQTCALTSAGGVKCWGNNANGQLGNGTTTPANMPVDVTGLTSGVTAIAAGDNHTCAALYAGGVKCWGWGTSGQLGNNSVASSSTPVDVQGLPAGVAATALSGGFRHTCAALSDGSARCWGRNDQGQLGDGTFTTPRPTAVTPIGLTSGVTAIAARGAHTCVVQTGSVKCFGLNSAGQLGNGSTTRSNTPVTATGLTNITAVAAGGSHSCALSSTGTVSCWGLNQEGSLGIGEPTTNNALTARTVTALTTPQTSLTASSQHTCSLQADQSVRCWGLNTSGQLGNGNTTRQFSPVAVLGL
jgi:alpha-tubulin suppressor-like RCC1 family protein